MNRLLLGVAAVAALAVAGAANAGVTVIGGGLAEACSKAALSGKTDLHLEQTCTQAIETEALDSRDRAGTYINRGILTWRRKDGTAPTSDFNEAARLRPEMGEAYVNRGAVSIGQHLYAQSLPDLNK